MLRKFNVHVALGAILGLLFFAGCGQPPPKNPTGVHTVAFTGSMKPLLNGGEMVTVSPVKINDVAVGDVVEVYWSGTGRNVLHQVIAIRVAANGVISLVTKGLNNDVRDEHITIAEDLIGKMTAINGVSYP